MNAPEMVTDKYGHTRPMTAAERIARTLATGPKINVTTGKPLPIEQQPPAVQAAATVDGLPFEPPVPNLGDTIVRVAGAMRVDPVALMADPDFVNGVADLDPGDSDGVRRAVMASTVVPMAPDTPASKLAAAFTRPV